MSHHNKKEQAMATQIEKQNLEAHVELCAERYKSLEDKLGVLETKVERLEEHVVFIRDKLSSTPDKAHKTIITIGTTIIGVLITAVIGLIIKLNS
jgi:predicted nuclease with TOPRIM domain